MADRDRLWLSQLGEQRLSDFDRYRQQDIRLCPKDAAGSQRVKTRDEAQNFTRLDIAGVAAVNEYKWTPFSPSIEVWTRGVWLERPGGEIVLIDPVRRVVVARPDAEV